MVSQKKTKNINLNIKYSQFRFDILHFILIKGFKSLYVSGAAVTASSGVPDIGYSIYILHKYNLIILD
jgi:hypothetical protein